MKKTIFLGFMFMIFALAVPVAANQRHHYEVIPTVAPTAYPTPCDEGFYPSATANFSTDSIDVECKPQPTVVPTEGTPEVATPSATVAPTDAPATHGDGLSDGRESGHRNADVPKAPPATGRSW